jgi:tetratricopeptide (TPR) repeat protein/predicted Ser/Thr protein kinase
MSSTDSQRSHVTLQGGDTAELSILVARFRQALDAGNNPRIREFLPASASVRSAAVIELVQTDMEWRLPRGENIRLEFYLEQFPELVGARDSVIGLIEKEWALRCKKEPHLSIDEYLERFPHLSDAIHSRWKSPPAGSAEVEAQQATPFVETNPRSTFLLPKKERIEEPPAAPVEPIQADGPVEATIPLPSPVQLKKETRRRAPQPAIPGYELLGELGRGGMGVVYRARQIGLNRVVALKMILSQEFAGPQQRRRFQSEAEALAQLQHPNIVQIYEIGEHEGRLFFSLEYVAGRSLADKLAGTPQPTAMSAQLTELLSRAVYAANNQGIVHRDLKPANVLICEDGTPKVTDFGLAKQLDAGAVETKTGMIIGTPCYMAPEQASGEIHSVGPPADVYALGAILYELLTGRPPFVGETTLDTLDQVRFQDAVPPSRIRPKLPRDLETICLKCLSKRPSDRYATADALADDLRRFQKNEPIIARPVTRWERAWKFARRKPAWAALILVSFFAVVSIGAGGWLYGRYANQRATLAERDLRELRETELLRTQVATLIHSGETAWANGDLQRARLDLEKATSQINRHPALEDLQRRASDLLADISKALSRQSAEAAKRNKLAQFRQVRDDAFFYSSQITGLDSATNTRTTRAICLQGLSLWNLGDSTTTQIDFSESEFTDTEKADVIAGAYELILVLADAISQPVGDNERADTQAMVALGCIDQAERLLGKQTRAALLRKAQLQDAASLQAEATASRETADRPDLKPVTAADFFIDGSRMMLDSRAAKVRLLPAVDAFENVLRIDPQHFWSQYFIAICNLRLQRPDLARASLTACASLRPDFIWTYILRAFVLSEMQDFDAAEADFRFALERLQPNTDARYILLVNRGVMRLRQNRLDDATADLRTAIELRPDEFQAHVNLAQIFQKAKDLASAEKEFTEALRLQPNLAALYRSRSRLRIEREENSTALADIEKAIQLERDDVDSKTEDLAQKGRLLEQIVQPTEALRAYDEALDINAGYAPALLLRGELLARQGRHAEALQSFDRYFQVGKPLAKVFLVRGLSRAMVADYAGAIDDYSRVIELQPDSRAYALRGWAYMVADAPKIALTDFHRAVELDTNNGDAFSGRALALAKLGQLRLAAKDAEESMRHGQSSSRLLFNVARTYACIVQHIAPDVVARNQEAAKLRTTARDRAIELLGEALELQSADERPRFWRSYVGKEPSFDPLRNTVGFVKLEKRFDVADLAPSSTSAQSSAN